MKMTRYISCADTAKLIRPELKKNFPSIKFSVKSSSYAGGASIRIGWTDGPTSKAVEKVVKVFQGSTFDGMTDSKTYHSSTLDGEEVMYGADSIHCSRTTTRTFLEAIIEQYCKRWGYPIATILVSGTEQVAYIDAFVLDHSNRHWFNELLWGTDAKDMYRAYEAAEEAKQAEHDEYVRDEPRRRAQEELDRLERERVEAERVRYERAREEVRRQQEEKRQREQAARRTTVAIQTREQALMFLGLTRYATNDEIKQAFRSKVRNAADGRGGYTVDMDQLVTAKEKALAS
jgi:hypothetical protein